MSRKNRRQPPLSDLQVKGFELPMYWLSFPNISDPFTINDQPELKIYTMKNPLVNPPKYKVGDDFAWGPENLSEMFPDSKILLVNTSITKENEAEKWEKSGYAYAEIDVSKDYSKDAISNFDETVQKFIEENPGDNCVVLVYSNLGINRPGFVLAGYLCAKNSLKIDESVKKCAELQKLPIYSQKAIESLSAEYGEFEYQCAEPEFMNEDSKTYPLGECGLTMDFAVNLRKLQRKEMSGKDKEKILDLLKKSLPGDWPKNEDGLPLFVDSVWDEDSITKIRNNNYMVTFEPRGKQCFLIATDSVNVFAVLPDMSVYRIFAGFQESRSSPKLPFVATCTWVEEMARVSALLTDLLMIGGESVSEKPLLHRMSLLNSEIVRRLKPEMNRDTFAFVFMFRPLAAIKHAKRLTTDFDKLCCRCEALSFVPMDESAGHTIHLTVAPSLILNVKYNGASKAILSTLENDVATPVAIFTLSSPKFTSLDGFQAKFTYDDDKKLVPFAVIKPAKTSEVTSPQSDFERFVNHFNNTTVNYEELYKEFESMSTPLKQD